MTDSFLAASPTATVNAPDSPHYLRALTDMADRRAVVTQDAIYTDNGIKLVDKGARIDSRLYDRLVQHKLREPIDRLLTVENPVDVPALIAAGQDLAKQGALPQMLAQALGSAAKLLAPLRSLPLPEPIAFKLTVMREQQPDLFAHSLQMMMVAVFLGLKSGLGERDCVPLAAAALLHDAGMLHLDPAWLDPINKVTGAQRKHLAAHPITSMLMLRDARVYSRTVEMAVLEHHERMDGSGYPRGLAGADISPMGRILLLAEVVTAFYEKYSDMPAQRLSLMLRLNHRKFPAALVAHVLPLLQEDVARDSVLLPPGIDVSALINTLADAFAQWEQRKATVPTAAKQEPGSAFAFADARLQALQKTLIEAGSHPEQQGDLLEQLQGDDATGLAEVALVGREALWQLQSIANACQSRWPQLPDRASPADAAVADWCDWAMRTL
jgi:HD-GYP domain-containing protein (c-di-GMP phosphodiesterase class II)